MVERWDFGSEGVGSEWVWRGLFERKGCFVMRRDLEGRGSGRKGDVGERWWVGGVVERRLDGK